MITIINTNFRKLLILRFNEPKQIVAIFIFIVALGLFVSQLIVFFKEERDANPSQLPGNNKKMQEIVDAHSVLFSKPLFGVYVPGLSDVAIKQSMLDLEIVGIMYSHHKEDSQVLIQAVGGDARAYVIGDILPGGARIKQINQKGIVVLYNGTLESLSLPQNELLFDKPAKPLIEE